MLKIALTSNRRSLFAAGSFSGYTSLEDDRKHTSEIQSIVELSVDIQLEYLLRKILRWCFAHERKALIRISLQRFNDNVVRLRHQKPPHTLKYLVLEHGSDDKMLCSVAEYLVILL